MASDQLRKHPDDPEAVRELRPRTSSNGCLLFGFALTALLIRTLVVERPLMDGRAAASQPLELALATLLPFGLLSSAAVISFYLGLQGWSSRGSIIVSAGHLRCPPGMLPGSFSSLVIRTSRITSVEAINDRHGRDVLLRLRGAGPVRICPRHFGGQTPVIAFLRSALADA